MRAPSHYHRSPLSFANILRFEGFAAVGRLAPIRKGIRKGCGYSGPFNPGFLDAAALAFHSTPLNLDATGELKFLAGSADLN